MRVWQASAGYLEKVFAPAELQAKQNLGALPSWLC